MKTTANPGDGDVTSREAAVAARETAVNERERATGDHEIVVHEREDKAHAREELMQLREEALRARETALQARSEADAARLDRERLVVQMRDANERLVVATLRADELVEQAQATDRVKDLFLAELGHELRNPLAPIVAALELMAFRDPDVFEVERGLIGRQVKQLVRLVDDLLDIARITQGKFELTREILELGDVVSQAVEVVRPLLQEKAHELIVRVATRGLRVEGDSLRLGQVVGNLLTNAAKYTPPGGRIEITAALEHEQVILRVRDTGNGLSPELLPRVFERFTQERHGIDRSRGGLGLGLAIVASIVTMHGGTVQAFSEGLRRGSEFVVTLPSVSAMVRPVAPVAQPTRPSPRRILVVDDHEDTAEITATLLALRGHDVRVAYDGAAALVAIEGFAPEVALLDIGLPGGMDGYELGIRLRRALPAGLRLVALSGFGGEANRHRSQQAGFDVHLVKPVALPELLEALDLAALSGPGTARAR